MPQLLAQARDMGHEGVQRTLQRLQTYFCIPSDKSLVQTYVRECLMCQQNKVSHLQPVRLLQPLPIPTQIWSDISMYFIEVLPRVNNKSVILTVVDRLSKFAHFIPLGHPYIASSVARTFFDEVVCLHGYRFLLS